MLSRLNDRWARWLPDGLIVLALAAAALVSAAGPLYRFELLGLGEAFALLRGGALAAMLLSAVGVVLLLALLRRPQGRWRCLVALVVAAPAFIGPWAMMRAAEQVPPIHDISTDLADPPVFQVLAERRGPDENPPGYPGEAVARQQREAYGDIGPARLALPPQRAFELARQASESMGWRIAAADAGRGRIEAVAVTPWWGFRDDVVVRLRPEAGGSRVDVRSASRVGVSDLGKNAARIREFLSRLHALAPSDQQR